MTTHERAVEVDTKLAELWEAREKAYGYLDSAKLGLASKLGIKPTYVSRNHRVVRESLDELVALANEKIASETTTEWKKREYEESLKWIEDYRGRIAAVRSEASPLEDEFDANRWSRFFLVKNHGGHIHSSMTCSTCYPTTMFGWLPDLSGLTEKDAVEAHGPLLCSVCFPSAPVEWTIGPVKDDSDKCPGSGEYVPRNASPSRRYLECPHCHVFVYVTSTGKLRSHKKKEAK